MSRWLRLLGLVGALLAAQLAFAMHGVEHLADIDHEHDEVCVQCLALAGTAPAPTPTHSAPVLAVAEQAQPQPGVSPRLTFSRRSHFLIRAPPVLQS